MGALCRYGAAALVKSSAESASGAEGTEYHRCWRGPFRFLLEAEFGAAVDLTRRSRFRSLTDLSVASFLAHHYGFVRREVVYAGYPTELVASNDPFFALNMRRIAQAAEKPKIVCLNEGGTPSRRWRRQLARFMTKQFPLPAPWECDV